MRDKGKFFDRSDPGRASVLKSIATLRRIEESGEYATNRDGAGYIRELGGVKKLFEYVAKLSTTRVIDIGAGTTKAISELSRAGFGGLTEYMATALRYRKEIDANLGREKTMLTPAETLTGIGNASVGCVLAVQSIAYSADPKRTVASIDRVLIPGGILKASFSSKDEVIGKEKGTRKGPAQFFDALIALGYDVHAKHTYGDTIMLLAIKPGNIDAPTAVELINADQKAFSSQQRELASALSLSAR